LLRELLLLLLLLARFRPISGRGRADLSGQKRIDGVKPIVKVLVALGLDQVALVARNNAKKVMKIRFKYKVFVLFLYFSSNTNGKEIHILVKKLQLLMHK